MTLYCVSAVFSQDKRHRSPSCTNLFVIMAVPYTGADESNTFMSTTMENTQCASAQELLQRPSRAIILLKCDKFYQKKPSPRDKPVEMKELIYQKLQIADNKNAHIKTVLVLAQGWKLKLFFSRLGDSEKRGHCASASEHGGATWNCEHF